MKKRANAKKLRIAKGIMKNGRNENESKLRVVEFQSLRVGTKLIVDRYRRNSV